MYNLFPAFIIIAVCMVVTMTEMIKKLDRKNRLKGYRVWIPAVLSGAVVWSLRLGEFFTPPEQVWFWWAVVFAFSVFAFEAVLKKIAAALETKDGAPF